MKVEFPGESKSFGAIHPGECFAFTRERVTSVCMKVDWLGAESIAVLWSTSNDWTVPQLVAATALARSSVIRFRVRSSLLHLTQWTFVLAQPDMSMHPVSSLGRLTVRR